MFVCVLPCVVVLCVTVLYCVGPLAPAAAAGWVMTVWPGESNPTAVVFNVMQQKQKVALMWKTNV